jgi:serine/threonine protein kinase
MIPFSCSHCQTPLKARDELAGKRIKCSRCQQVLTVPARSATAVAATASAQGSVSDDATLPPSRPAPSVADAPTLAPAAGRRPDATVPYHTGGHEATGQDGQEIVEAGVAYRLEGEIARGGMGAVIRALDRDIRREVAVKFLLNQADEGQRARFLEEAQITGQLEHPNIVPIHQLGVHQDGRCFFSMKMVKGRSLADILKEQGKPGASASGEPGASATGGPFTLGRLLNIFASTCNALAYAHSRRVIHRDLKPANIMVGDFGEVYVMDWGLAKVLGQELGIRSQKSGGARSKVVTSRAADANLTQAGAIMGTPAYMPPEQAAGEAVDQRSDIYSLGAILYEILTLAPPVGRGGDQMAILMRVIDGAILVPEKQAPERARQGLIPPELSAVALKALAKDPANRYQTVEALQRDIQLFLEGRSVSAKQDSAWEMFKKLVKRNKGVSVATAGAMVLLLAGAAIAFYFINQERQEAVTARDKAEENYNAFLKEQEEKRIRMRKSAPAFLKAARLTANEKDFKSALDQVNIALESDPDLTGAYLLQGQLLLALERYSEGVKPLEEYCRRDLKDEKAMKLAELARKPEPDKAAYFYALHDVFEKQKQVLLAGHMMGLAQRFVGPLEQKLLLWRKKLLADWPKVPTNNLHIDAKGRLVFGCGVELRNLEPLRGLPLVVASLQNAWKLESLEPLRGMPLEEVHLSGSYAQGSVLKDLGPLRGMKLRFLGLWLMSVGDFAPLKGMPLETLGARGAPVESLEPLRGMKTLKHLDFFDCYQIRDIGPLEGIPLRFFRMNNSGRVTDLSPLQDMPLEELHLGRATGVQNFETLRPLKLTRLDLGLSRFDNLDILKDMPLTWLDLTACWRIKELGPLRTKKLTWLSVAGCKEIRKIDALGDMPLTELNLSGTGVTDLAVVRNMTKLETLQIIGVPAKDVWPLAGLKLTTLALTPAAVDPKGLEEIRRQMKSLRFVIVDGGRRLEASEFWRLYDKGEFKK